MANANGHIKRMILMVWCVCMTMPPAAFTEDTDTNQNSAPDTSQPNTSTMSAEELDQLLAPIALYPDSLLSQALMASTYPLEIVQADRWVKSHPDVSGDQLDSALKEQDWDVSVKSLAFFPSVLGMMSEKLDWTSKVGDAFLGQQQDVMDSVQHLRAKAKETGNLKSTKQENVVLEKETIRIEPADTQVVYVPVYDPVVVYGPWWYPAYPPFAFYPVGYYAAGPGVVFTAGFVAGPVMFGGFYWGRHEVFVRDDNVFIVHHGYEPHREYGRHDSHGPSSWHHDPYHRRAVPYRQPAVASRFGRSDVKTTEARRRSGRDRLGPQPGGRSPNVDKGRGRSPKSPAPSHPAQRSNRPSEPKPSGQVQRSEAPRPASRPRSNAGSPGSGGHRSSPAPEHRSSAVSHGSGSHKKSK